VLKTQAEEVKRLEWIEKKLNHSHGLKNRHKDAVRQPRSKSAGKRVFVRQGEYQGWTNTFKRSTIAWDESYGLLDSEKDLVNLKQLEKRPPRCCGNSPGK